MFCNCIMDTVIAHICNPIANKVMPSQPPATPPTMARGYLMDVLPGELRNKIVDEVISSQPLILEVYDNKPLLVQGVHHLAVTQTCHRAREHSKQANCARLLQLMPCASSLIRECSDRGRRWARINAVDYNMHFHRALELVPVEQIKDIEICIGSLGIRPCTPKDHEAKKLSTGNETACQIITMLSRKVANFAPAKPCFVSFSLIDGELQPGIDGCRATLGIMPLGPLVLDLSRNDKGVMEKCTVAYFQEIKRTFYSACGPRRQWISYMVSAELYSVERQTLKFVRELAATLARGR